MSYGCLSRMDHSFPQKLLKIELQFAKSLVRPLFDLILVCFMLNLVELRSNCPLLLLIVPKTRSFFFSGEIIRF